MLLNCNAAEMRTLKRVVKKAKNLSRTSNYYSY